MHALIQNNIVIQTSKNTFEVHPSLVWQECPSDVEAGWKFTNGNFTPDVPVVTWEEIRQKRNNLLLESDWVVIKAQESGKEVPKVWVEYREALRNITLQPNLQNIVWPIKPS